jgi:Trk K+ transport system NAD-binding subunit
VADSVILCGLGKLGGRVLEFLRATDLTVVVIDRNRDANDAQLAGMTFIRGDCRDSAILEQAGAKTAQAVLIVTSDDLVNTSTALAVRRLNPDIRIVVRMFNPTLMTGLGRAVGNTQALSVSALTAPLLAQAALTGEVLGSFLIDGVRRQIAKVVIGPASSLIGRRIDDIAREREVLPLAHECNGKPAELLQQVPGDAQLQVGDELIACGELDRMAELVSSGETADWDHPLLNVRWASRMRRFGRVAWRAITEIDLALMICAVVLLVVVVMSTAIYSLSGMSTSVPDGVYRTISVVATGADMRADQYVGWQKVFVSALRIFGAVLLAAFTAIVTNFLLRARLGGALEVRRIPDSGHFVVCGLGNVGYRIVEELLQANERVVIIERSRDNPFISTCRRLGAAVIIGDAVVPEALRQARAGTSRAVIATTLDDLANLEIALLARQLNPKQRVVVRLADDALAQTLREVADVRLALSVPNLAAPAFVAALYGDRVHSLFRINRRMLAAVELAVQPDDPCLKDQSLRAIAIDYDLLPVVAGEANRRLLVGEKFTAIALLSDLDRLFRRQPAPNDWQVELLEVPAVAIPSLTPIVRIENVLGAEDVEVALRKLPLRLGGKKTRGQAEELRSLLEREHAVVKLNQIK